MYNIVRPKFYQPHTAHYSFRPIICERLGRENNSLCHFLFLRIFPDTPESNCRLTSRNVYLLCEDDTYAAILEFVVANSLAVKHNIVNIALQYNRFLDLYNLSSDATPVP